MLKIFFCQGKRFFWEGCDLCIDDEQKTMLKDPGFMSLYQGHPLSVFNIPVSDALRYAPLTLKPSPYIKGDMRNILVMRHAKPQPNPDLDDFDIPLSKEGEIKAVKVGKSILEKGIVPDIILSSPAARAEATARIVAEACCYEGDILLNKGFYYGSTETAVFSLKKLTDGILTVLLIGHNPTWTELVYGLQAEPQMVTMKQATLVLLTCNDHSWEHIDQGMCNLEWIL